MGLELLGSLFGHMSSACAHLKQHSSRLNVSHQIPPSVALAARVVCANDSSLRCVHHLLLSRSDVSLVVGALQVLVKLSDVGSFELSEHLSTFPGVIGTILYCIYIYCNLLLLNGLDYVHIYIYRDHLFEVVS